MHWIAISPKDIAKKTSEARRWMGTEDFRSHSGLKSAKYFAAVLRLDGETRNYVNAKGVSDQQIRQKFFALAIAVLAFVITGSWPGICFTA